MQVLTVKYLPGAARHTPIAALVAPMQDWEQHAIQQQPWPQYHTQASAKICMAFTDDCILLQYTVTEPNIRAMHSEINTPVYEDSCVEFFIAPDEVGYYNFEFNCVGAALAGYGKNKQQRSFLERHHIEAIRTESRIQRNEKGLFTWQLVVQIPFASFQHHPGFKWKGSVCRGNFYKCGDGLPRPHFLSWTPIDAPAPDFHLPRFFGSLHFEA